MEIAESHGKKEVNTVLQEIERQEINLYFCFTQKITTDTIC